MSLRTVSTASGTPTTIREVDMSYYLFLDDERSPSQVVWVAIPQNVVWEVARNYDQFVDIVNTRGIPKYVTFDHDLAEEHYQTMLKEVEHFTAFRPDNEGGMNVTFSYGSEKTGYECAKWLVDQCIFNGVPFPEYEVHSMNPVGGARIEAYIANAKKHAGV